MDSVATPSRIYDLYHISQARVEVDSADSNKFGGYIVSSIEDGLLSATPVHLTLDQITRTSTPSPTPAPTPTPIPYVPPVPVRDPPPIRDQGWYDYIYSLASAYAWDAHIATRIILCEAGGNATSYSPYGYYGAMQINYWFEGWDDLVTNIRVGYEAKYVPAGGWSPWAWCWRNG